MNERIVVRSATTGRFVSRDAVKQSVIRSTIDSAKLERREIPQGYMRPANLEQFLSERRKRA